MGPIHIPVAPAAGSSASTLRRAWPLVRFVLGIGIVVLAAVGAFVTQRELSGFSTVFDNLKWWWIPPALAGGVGLVRLLRRSAVRVLAVRRPRRARGRALEDDVRLAGDHELAPGGTAFSAVYGFRWFRRFGADDTLAAWSLAGTVVASVVSLSLGGYGRLGPGDRGGGIPRPRPRHRRCLRHHRGHRGALRLRAPAGLWSSRGVSGHRAKSSGDPAAIWPPKFSGSSRLVTAVRLGRRQVISILSVGRRRTGCSTAPASP